MKIVTTKTLAALLASAVAVALVGCGKDKSIEQYQRERLQENLAVYESVAGTYTGAVYSTATNKSIGALQLDLSAETTSVASSTGELPIGAPVLVTNVSFRDQSILNIRIDSSFYDQSSGAYNATVVVDRQTVGQPTPGGDKTAQVVIKGFIRNGHLTGTIGALNNPRGSAKFDLVLNGTPLDQIRKGAPKGPLDTVGVTKQYSGRGTMPDSRTGKSTRRSMTLQVNKPSQGPAGDFVDIFNPDILKFVNVSVEFSEAVSISFINIVWNPANRTIDGSNTINSTSGTYTVFIQCNGFEFTQQSEPFHCDYWSSRSPVISMDFQP